MEEDCKVLFKEQVDPNDMGFLFGFGLFETMLVDYKGNIFLLDEHLGRLKQSGDFFNLPITGEKEEIKKTILATIKEKQLRNQVVRLTVSAGNSSKQIPSSLYLTIRENPYTPEKLAQGCRLMLSSVPRNEFSSISRHKTTNYLENYILLQEAARQGYDDMLLLNIQKHVAETAKSNLFYVKGNVLYTPSLSCGILPGIIRGWILQKATPLNLQCKECSVGVEEIIQAQEVFVTNSLIGIQHVQSIDDHLIGDGKIGKVTACLQGMMN